MDEELWRQFGSKLKLHGLEISQVLGDLLRAYLSGDHAVKEGPREKETHKHHVGDPAITPQSQHERELVAGLLLLFRDRREIAQGVKEIVAGLLTNWVNKAKAAANDDVNGGKKSA